MKKLLVLTLVVVMYISLFVGCLSLNNEPIIKKSLPTKGHSFLFSKKSTAKRSFKAICIYYKRI
ncbi:hypothetical protein ES695_00280 [Candidatus Atribacteria bacterium 1244-E10-H5-B2]|nr:MAG: hypothetical protein ES695_00280 [Candidatus Atribacteria bacterium 1244-E10-H5-B2]